MKYILRLGRPAQPNYIKAPAESRYRELPFDKVSPEDMQIEGSKFCLSGIFPSGRKAAETLIIAGGGLVVETVAAGADYVIVGEQPSRGWKFGNYGNKINDAIEYRKQFKRPMLIREADWLAVVVPDRSTEAHLDQIAKSSERSLWLLHNFETGYTDGWACHLPAAFRRALDIQQTARKALGMDTLAWTQGVNFNFNSGDVIYDSIECYEKPWGEALKTMAFSIHVREASPAAVRFSIFLPNNERTRLVLHQEGKAEPVEFVRLLITGSCRKLSD